MIPARSGALLRRAGLLLIVSSWAVQAGAQDKPRPRPKPLPEPSDRAANAGDSVGALNSIGARDPSRRVPAGGAAKPPLIAPPPPLVLRSAVHSRYSRAPAIARSTAGQCRAACAVTRTQCAGGEGDASSCDPGWTRCLSDCAGLTYGRAAPP